MKIEKESLGYEKREYMSDVLSVPLDKLQAGLSVVGKNKNKTEINGLNVMNGLISILVRLLDLQMIISDELLMLCWEYYNNMNDNNNITKDEFLKLFIWCK